MAVVNPLYKGQLLRNSYVIHHSPTARRIRENPGPADANRVCPFERVLRG